MFDFEEALRLVSKQTVLCVGDVMLDDFVYGEVVAHFARGADARSRGQAQCRRDRRRRQGRAQHRRARRALHLCRSGRRRRRRPHAHATRSPSSMGRSSPISWSTEARPTTRKVRFVSEHHSTHLLRADWEDVAPASAESQAAVIALCRSGAAAGRRGGALRLRQGRADRAGDPRHHRRGAPARHAGHRRSEVPRLSRLSRGDPAHAQRARNWPPPSTGR